MTSILRLLRKASPTLDREPICPDMTEVGRASLLTRGWEFDRVVDTSTFDKVYNAKACPMI
ncbi:MULTISPECIES: hypothetical protein [unclassified Roseibium]|uniref:hypothetical protein n=1 Tax=unclassified Roseibium TaxID=2629323 RepID=UPI0031701F58